MNRNRKNTSHRHRTFARRKATTFVELLVAITVLSSLMALALPASLRVARLRQVHRQHLLAMEATMNQMDHLLHLPAAEVKASAGAIELPDYLVEQLDDASLHLAIEPVDFGLRLHLKLSWTNRLGNPGATRLIGWWVGEVGTERSIDTEEANS